MRDNSAIESSLFEPAVVPDHLLKKAENISKFHFQIPFVELWNEDTINTILRQIEYFNEAGWLKSKSVGTMLCDKVVEMFQLIQHQAESQLKWWKGKPAVPEVPWEFYFNELTVLDNSILYITDELQLAMIGYNSVDYLFTSHAGFCHESRQYFQRQISKSMKLSGASEKERNKFFNRMYDRVAFLRKSIA